MKKRFYIAALLGASLSGCNHHEKNLYSWGSFEKQLFETWTKNGVAAEKQIKVMEEEFQKAQSKHLHMPPGFHAHLGFLYYHAGNLNAAEKSFSTETELFPESRTYMAFVLKNLKK